MIHHPLFLDDDCVATALDEAAEAAIRRLADLLPELGASRGDPFRKALRAHLGRLLTGRAASPGLPPLVHGEDAFGDSFSLDDLPLPRAGAGYAVQMLDTDTLLDRGTGKFLAVRNPALSGLFESFEAAGAAGRAWLRKQNATIDQCPLAIVPAYYDYEMSRHVLIYGVLRQSP